MTPLEQQLTSEISKFKGYLERAGWGPCNADACNCNGWHKVRQSQAERELEDEISKLKSEVEKCESALRNISCLFGIDPSDGEGTEPEEIFELTESKVKETSNLNSVLLNQNSICKLQLAELSQKLAEVEKDFEAACDDRRFVWNRLQKLSPWCESNDMEWSDEIDCGFNGLEQQLSSAEQLVCKMREALEKCRKCSCGRKQQMERDDLSNLGGWVLPHADDCASSIAIEALSLSAPIAGKYIRKEEA